MSGVPFHDTRAGRIFYDVNVPRIAEALESIADRLTALGALESVADDEPEPLEALLNAARGAWAWIENGCNASERRHVARELDRAIKAAEVATGAGDGVR